MNSGPVWRDDPSRIRRSFSHFQALFTVTQSVSAFQLPVLGEAQTADRFLTNLPESCGPTGKIATLPLPMSMEEARKRGWDELDVVIVSGDAYIDHPVSR